MQSTSANTQYDQKEASPGSASDSDKEKTKKQASPESSSSSDHTDRDGIRWETKQQREDSRMIKDFHDSVIHKVTLQNDPIKLRDLLQKGLRAFNKSIDGATPLHRAAEIGSVACAEVLLEFNNDINEKNF